MAIQPRRIRRNGHRTSLGNCWRRNLRDDSKCSREIREYFSRIESRRLAIYVEQCLEASFSKSGLVFQDLVNELGRRLDYKVENGKYQGTTQSIGFDGIWQSAEGRTLVVEVKTSDAYRVSLEKIAGYRKRLSDISQIGQDSTVLIVVGRQDTGELEAQVRGSRHAWDVRIISADGLTKLVQLQENSEGGTIGKKIRTLLTPMEYTRLDELVDVMLTTATEVEKAAATDSDLDQDVLSSTKSPEEKVKGVWQFTDSKLLQQKRFKIVEAVSSKLGTNLINKTKATLWSADHETRIAVTISKRYEKRGTYPYWYAYHPQWDEFLAEGKNSFLVLGCMDLPKAFCIPRHIVATASENLNTTTTERSTYWHLHIVEEAKGRYELLLPKAQSNLDITPYATMLED